MSASSVTGRGLGSSNGEYKPENHSGCCGHPVPDTSEPTIIRRSCAAKVKVGGTIRYKTGSSNRIRVC